MTKDYHAKQLNYNRTVIDFMRWDYIAFGTSIIFLILAVAIITLKDFNWGLDFIGGSVVEINFSKPVDLDKIRDNLANHSYKDVRLQSFGSRRDIMIRLPTTEGITGQEIGKSILSILHDNIDHYAVVKRIEFVGPIVGNELAQTGAIALLASLICIFIYISVRFEWRLATATVISLAHDVIITLGIVSFFHIEIDMTIVASLMSVIGYSLNDSIVVADRIRENFRKTRRGTSYEIVNVSLTQTLSRTLITSGAFLFAVLMLYFFGGIILSGFSLVLLIGVTLGTISSVYVVSALALKLGMQREHLIVSKVEKEGADQHF